jgi:hypothetical protein
MKTLEADVPERPSDAALYLDLKLTFAQISDRLASNPLLPLQEILKAIKPAISD